MKNLFNVDEMASVLAELETKNKDVAVDEVMDDEMKASQRRVEEILEKHSEQN